MCYLATLAILNFLVNNSPTNKAIIPNTISFNTNGINPAAKACDIVKDNTTLSCKVPINSVNTTDNAVPTHNNILLLYSLRYATTKAVSINPYKYPPVAPNIALKPPLKLAKTGIPIAPNNTKITIAIVADFDSDKMYIVKEKSTATAPTEEVNLEPSDWAKAEVEKAENYGITTNLYSMGIESGNYFQDNITREEFATLIVGCIEQLEIGVFAPLEPDEEYIEISEDTPLKDIYGVEFTDTDNEDVYIAYEMGIVKGVGNDMFAPKQNITRQEIAVMMHRAIQYAEQETGLKYINDNSEIQGFSDLSSVADWAVASVGTLANNGIMKGTGETTLSPLDNTSREQAIILAGRIFELMQ